MIDVIFWLKVSTYFLRVDSSPCCVASCDSCSCAFDVNREAQIAQHSALNQDGVDVGTELVAKEQFFLHLGSLILN